MDTGVYDSNRNAIPLSHDSQKSVDGHRGHCKRVSCALSELHVLHVLIKRARSQLCSRWVKTRAIIDRVNRRL